MKKINLKMFPFWIAVLVISTLAITSYKSGAAVSQAGVQSNQVGVIASPQTLNTTSTNSTSLKTSSTSTKTQVVPKVSPTTSKPAIIRRSENEGGEGGERE